MADQPAATLLHLGPGLGNGLGQPAQRPPGAHADRQHRRRPRHLPQAVRRPARVRHRDGRPATCRAGSASSASADDVAGDAAEAVAAAIGPPGPGRHADPARRRVAGPRAASRRAPAARRRPGRRSTTTSSTRSAKVLRSRRAGRAAARRARVPRGRALVAASRVANATGAKLLAETFPARLERGAGLPDRRAPRLPGRVHRRCSSTACRHLVLVDAKAPVSFFAYPGKASDLVPDGCEVHVLAGAADDAVGALEALADAVGAPARRRHAPAAGAARACRPAPLTAEAVRQRARRPAARGRDRVRRGQHAGPVRARAPPPARPATTG